MQNARHFLLHARNKKCRAFCIHIISSGSLKVLLFYDKRRLFSTPSRSHIQRFGHTLLVTFVNVTKQEEVLIIESVLCSVSLSHFQGISHLLFELARIRIGVKVNSTVDSKHRTFHLLSSEQIRNGTVCCRRQAKAQIYLSICLSISIA